MNKKAKTAIIVGMIVAAGIGALVGGLNIYRNVNIKPVKVFPVDEISMEDVWEDSQVTSGIVSAEGIQKVFLSDSQSGVNILVTEGQEVKKGDTIISYDTSLSQVDISRAEIKAGRLKLQLKNDERELERLMNMQPHETHIVEPDNDVEYVPEETPRLLQGDGSIDDPFIWLFDANDKLTRDMLNEMLGTSLDSINEIPDEYDDSYEDEQDFEDENYSNFDEDPEASNIFDDTDILNNEEDLDNDEDFYDDLSNGEPVYIVIINRENNASNAPVTARYGLALEEEDGVISGISMFAPVLPEYLESFEEIPEAYEESTGSDYTAQELAQMRAEKESDIVNLKHEIALAENELVRLKLEASGNDVKSNTDGKVIKVRDALEARAEGKAVVELSDGGSYFVTTSVDEFEREKLFVGQQVSIQAYGFGDGNTGEYEGSIEIIYDRPQEESSDYYSYSEGNTNVSYYPVKIKLSADADLDEDTYVDISFLSDESQSSDGIYIANAFIRSDGGMNYIYVRDENGQLVRRNIRPGRDLWGEYTQIKSGIKLDDYIAFPYGKDVFEGAKTKEDTVESLYSENIGY